MSLSSVSGLVAPIETASVHGLNGNTHSPWLKAAVAARDAELSKPPRQLWGSDGMLWPQCAHPTEHPTTAPMLWTTRWLVALPHACEQLPIARSRPLFRARCPGYPAGVLESQSLPRRVTRREHDTALGEAESIGSQPQPPIPGHAAQTVLGVAPPNHSQVRWQLHEFLGPQGQS
jgi:hypothetical protein